jgi:GNAT superfamily N-acetyltransferase
VTIRIDVATRDDISTFIASAENLVATDAGRYDPAGTDVGWAAAGGTSYASSLIGDDANLVLLARSGDVVVGHLVGRLHGPGNVHPLRVAELESLFVGAEHRGHGIGEQLVQRFLAWAAAQGAQRASVAAYAANEGAQRFYVRHGFTPRSVVLDREI